MNRILIFATLLFTTSFCIQQKEEMVFKGFWATTDWTFIFRPDNTYTLTSKGHYGNTMVNGNYVIKGDTLILKSGFRQTDGTVNEKYLMEGDTCIIDLKLKYDYCRPNKSELYNSRIRK